MKYTTDVYRAKSAAVPRMVKGRGGRVRSQQSTLTIVGFGIEEVDSANQANVENSDLTLGYGPRVMQPGREFG
jgi:hypothetical protein